MPDPAPLRAQDAAEALIAIGYPVSPEGEDMECWRLGDFLMSDEDLLAFAARKGIVIRFFVIRG